jgi:FG-GAP-like repeat
MARRFRLLSISAWGLALFRCGRIRMSGSAPVRYAQPAGVYRNRGNKKFEDVSAKLGRALQKPVVARGAAYADYDNDGDLDLVIMANNGAARLLRNDNGNQNDMLRVKPSGRGRIATASAPKSRSRQTKARGSLRW